MPRTSAVNDTSLLTFINSLGLYCNCKRGLLARILRRRGYNIVSFPADFSPSVGKSTSGKLPIAFRSRIHCLRHVVHCKLTAMQSYVTSHVKLQCANIPAHLNRNGIRSLPDVLFPTEGRGKKSAGHETSYNMDL